jgi:hypothetical protein
MNKLGLTRTNLLLDNAKVRRLRRSLNARSNSEAVRRLIDDHLAIRRGLTALKDLQSTGGLEDVFQRASGSPR